jgi:hypothetical protein
MPTLYLTKKDILKNIEFIKEKVNENEYKQLENLYLSIYKELNKYHIKQIMNESYNY